jgi:ribosomal protein S18 acetylase RimI-like enzyme
MILPPSPLIRAATEADSAEIGRVHAAAWRETYPGLMPDPVIARLSAEDRARQWREGLARGAKGPMVFVSESLEGSLTGFGAAGPARETDLGWQAEIHALYILRSGQRQGIGLSLMRHLAVALAARNRQRAGLWVLTANEPARAFYARLGGRADQRRTDQSEGWPCDETAYVWDDFPAALNTLE